MTLEVFQDMKAAEVMPNAGRYVIQHGHGSKLSALKWLVYYTGPGKHTKSELENGNS
jgi:hypothetical protein